MATRWGRRTILSVVADHKYTLEAALQRCNRIVSFRSSKDTAINMHFQTLLLLFGVTAVIAQPADQHNVDFDPRLPPDHVRSPSSDSCTVKCRDTSRFFWTNFDVSLSGRDCKSTAEDVHLAAKKGCLMTGFESVGVRIFIPCSSLPCDCLSSLCQLHTHLDAHD